MHPTRSTRLRRALGLVAAPALVLTAAACGDDDDASSTASFCDEYKSLEERFSDVDDPTSEDFGEALEAFKDLDPPEEIADEWDTMVNALEGFADIDLSDPEALENADIDTEAVDEASTRIDNFLKDECGIEQ